MSFNTASTPGFSRPTDPRHADLVSTILGGRGFFSDLHTRRLLDESLIDIVASDAHNLRERPTRLHEAYQKLREDYDDIYAANLTGMSRNEEFWQTLASVK